MVFRLTGDDTQIYLTKDNSLTPIALRMRDGEWEYPGGIEEPDLSGYDRFITGTDDGGEER